MTYILEQWDSVELSLQYGPYAVPVDSLLLALEFVGGSVPYPPLPWATPTLSTEYSALMQTAGRSETTLVALLIKADVADAANDAVWGKATRSDFDIGISQEEAGHVDAGTTGIWGAAKSLQREQSYAWQVSGFRDRNNVQSWNEGTRKDRPNFISSWIMKTPARDIAPSLPWLSVNLSGTPYDDLAARLALLNTDTALTVSLDAPAQIVRARSGPVNLAFGFVAPERPIVPHDIPKRLTARQANERDALKHIPWGDGESVWQDWNLPYPVDDSEEPEPEPVEEPPRKAVYRIMNTLQIRDIATDTPLAIQNVNISLDIDSISWKFTGSVFGRGSLDLIQPDGDGMKDISVLINGHQWIFAIEKYSSDEKFPTTIFNIEGVSRTQYMAADYAPARSYTNAIATTAAQAATAELLDTGFALTWDTGGDEDLPDWNIPEGALSFRDKSPAQVIGQIVTAAGGVMIPNMASDGWTIQPRYKVAPWDWHAATPDVIVYIGMVTARSAQYEPAPAFDSCFVSGVNQGVSVDVQRTGSGGLNPMPDIFDDLITDAQAAISRGRAELSGAGNKVVQTLRIPVPEDEGAPGILIPGMIAKITHDDSDLDYFALVLSTSIGLQKSGGAEVYQSVTLERTA